MKLWQKSTPLNKKIETFTIGKDRELDLLLAPYDVQGTLAHITMLTSIGLMEPEELAELKKELQQINRQITANQFEIEEGIEDVHSQIENMLTQKLGDIGKKVHSGRSRNDQVLVDLRLYLRAEIDVLVTDVVELFNVLQSLSEEHKQTKLPGYTHMQVAMVSTFGLWFGAYAEAMTDDLHLVQAAYRIINQNPLGSAAGYGNSFPLDRQMTTTLLGFDNLSYNSINAQLGRGKTEMSLAFAMAALSSTLGKLAMDICLFSNQNYGFVSLPDEFTTGSSIMPHKKNPDVFELIRARCNQLQALPNEILMMTSNLPHGYHRDFQILKENLFPAIQSMKSVLQISALALQNIEVKKNLLEDDKYKLLFTVEAVNQAVLQGIPFRDAYQKIGKQVEEGNFDFKGQLKHTHEGSIGQLNNDEIKNKMEKIVLDFGFEKYRQAISKLIEN